MSALLFLTTTLAIFLSSWSAPANALTVLTQNEAAKTVAIQDVTDNHHVISGKIVNKSPHIIRDPEVLIEYHWLWANEFNPGENPPGRAAYIKVNREIQPGEAASFTHSPQPPLADRKDGRFLPEVLPAGFTVVVTPKGTASLHAGKNEVGARR